MNRNKVPLDLQKIKEEKKHDELVAYEVFVDDMRCFTFAKSPPAARWNAVFSAREAGFYCRGKEWPSSIYAKRAPQYDKSPLQFHAFRKCFSPE